MHSGAAERKPTTVRRNEKLDNHSARFLTNRAEPLPSSSSKGEKKRLRRAPWRVLTVMTPEVQAPSRAASPAPVSSTSPHSVGPAARQQALASQLPRAKSPCGDRGCWGGGSSRRWRLFYCFGKSEMPICSTAHSQVGQSKTTEDAPLQTRAHGKQTPRPALPVGHSPPPPPLASLL